ncbi:MAG: beta-propeller fold lactonase family protein [Terracidiphilus sp.]|nr:beta-propeller fold lactonase family protein [Terracidiphilus sp.]
MKFNKSGQLLLVSAASLLVAGLVTACGTLTVDFVYVTSAKAAGTYNYGEVDVFEVNSESGFMRQIPTSPFPSGGRNPVAEAVSSDNTNLYVVNQDDNTIVQFVIGNDGKLYPQHTVNTPGIYPLAVAVNGSNLFVVDTYQPLSSCSSAAPCSGSIAVLPITAATSSTAASLGSPVANGSLTYWPLSLPGKPNDVLLPTAVKVLPSGTDVYVTAYDTTANTGYVFGFSVASGGALTALNGGVPFAAGTHPSAIASDPSGAYLYVADATNGVVLGYKISSGSLSAISGSPFPAGGQPSAMAIDSTGKFAYVTNAADSTVTAYSISSGVLSRLGSYATGLQPVAIGIDPSSNQYVYTANFLGNNVSGFQLNASTGALLNTQNAPYNSNSQPTAVAAIPHGVKTK